jgi:hypothetical protein
MKLEDIAAEGREAPRRRRPCAVLKSAKQMQIMIAAVAAQTGNVSRRRSVT